MALHQLTSFTLGVPNLGETAAYYREFGLADEGDGWLATRDGGRQLRLVPAPVRRLIELRIGVDGADDLARVASRLHRLGIDAVADPAAGPGRSVPASWATSSSAPPTSTPPRRSSATASASRRATTSKTSAPSCGAPLTTTTCWCCAPAEHPERHVWGLGRHHAGSNFFYYFRDPSGTFSEYYSDMDCVPADQVWTPETFQGAIGLFSWGPPPPPSFLHPDDLAALMAGSHSRAQGS